MISQEEVTILTIAGFIGFIIGYFAENFRSGWRRLFKYIAQRNSNKRR